MKVLKPSSCHMCIRSFEPTIIGIPHVPDLVRDDVVELVLVGALVLHRDHRVFHAADRPLDGADLRIGILEPALRVFLIDMRDMSAASFHVSIALGR